MKDTWKDIPGYEGFYQINQVSSVRSLDRYCTNSLGYKRFIKGKVLTPFIDQDGYHKYLLYPNRPGWKNRRSLFAHHLMMLAFNKPKPSKKSVVRHIDGDSANNTITNIVWGTHKENSMDRSAHGRTYKPPKGHLNARAILSKNAVAKIKKLKGNMLQKDVAEMFGVSKVTIYRVWTGKRYE